LWILRGRTETSDLYRRSGCEALGEA
jgi:hypothetical protein